MTSTAHQNELRERQRWTSALSTSRALRRGLWPALLITVTLVSAEGFTATSQAAVMFVDSGFHTNQASSLEVFAIPVNDGTTVTVFLTAEGNPVHGIDALGPLARRIFKTVDWH